MDSFMSAEDHLQRKHMLYEKFGAQIEAVLASQPQLLKKEEKLPDEKAKDLESEANARQLEMLLEKKGLSFSKASSTTSAGNQVVTETRPTCSSAMSSVSTISTISMMSESPAPAPVPAPTPAAALSAASASTLVSALASSAVSGAASASVGTSSPNTSNALGGAKTGFSDTAAQLDTLLAKKGLLSEEKCTSEDKASPLTAQQFIQVDLVMSRLKAFCVKLELENQVLNTKLLKASDDLQAKDARIRCLERELEAARSGS
uniref:Uncharacterized protein n=1 Tax=Eutreptiella gymnastica TaxID=73025 RepID=A0A7S4LCZ9_9EUGL